MAPATNMRRRANATTTLTTSVGLLVALIPAIRAAAVPPQGMVTTLENITTPSTLSTAYTSATSLPNDKNDPIDSLTDPCLLFPEQCQDHSADKPTDKGLVTLPRCMIEPGLWKSDTNAPDLPNALSTEARCMVEPWLCKPYAVPEAMVAAPKADSDVEEPQIFKRKTRTNPFWPNCPWGS